MSDYGPGRKNQYFVPGKGISREVITADICKYLDHDATVRPHNYQGQDGYMVFAYRNLTSAMIDDLKKDSGAWEKEKRDKRGGAPPGARQPKASQPEAYVESRIHQRRQMYGPSDPETPAPEFTDYPPGRQPPIMDYSRQQPSPQQSSYTVEPTNPGYGPSSRSPGYQPGFVPAPDHQDPRMAAPRMTQYDYPYGADPNYSRPPMGDQPPMSNRYPQPPATVPPQAQRDPRYVSYDDVPRDPRDPRGDMRGDMRADSRAVRGHDSRGGYQDPRMDPRYQPVDSRGSSRQYGETRTTYQDPRYRGR